MSRPRYLAAALALPLFVAEFAHAAKLPEWARPVAAAAPEVPAGASDIPARVLFREDRLTVGSDGTFHVRRRLATQALSNGGADQTGIATFHFNDGAKVSRPRAWHLPPGEKAERGHGEPLDLTLSDSFLTDSRTRVVALEGVKKGSLVFFEFEADEVPPVLAYTDMFFEGSPTTQSRFEVEAPPGWTVRDAWLRQSGPAPAVAGGVRTWELRDLPWDEPEPLGDAPVDRAPWLVVGFEPPAGTTIRPAVVPDWQAFSRWFEDLAQGRDAVTPQVRTAAEAVFAGSGTEFFERVVAAANYVRDRVRYVAKEVGVGAFQPRPADKVAKDLYGDCKDKATLFRSILTSNGIASYGVLINATMGDTVAVQVPDARAFNHFIAAVVVPQGVNVPARFADAVVDAGDLGKLFIVDTTAEFVTPGDLPWQLAGRQALVVAGARGRLVTLPRGDVSTNRTERRIVMLAADDKTVAIQLESKFLGAPATEERAWERASSLDRRKETERSLLHVWPGATVEEYATKPETDDGAYVETVSLRVPSEGALVVFPLAAIDLERVPLGKRHGAVDYGYPRSIFLETRVAKELTVPTLPRDTDTAGNGWSAASRFVADDGLRATLTVELAKTRFEPDAFTELKKLWAAAGKSPILPRAGEPAR